MVASSLKDSEEAVTPVQGLDIGLVRVAAIYGANASGKSNVVKALDYMSTAVRSSHRHWPPEGPIPREAFLLDAQSKTDPSSFEADLLLDGVRMHYGFSLDDREILDEWLDAYPIGSKPVRRQMWFKRERRTFTFGNKLDGDNSSIERLTRPNSLYLSAAAQNNHETLLPLYKWFAEQFSYVPREREHLSMETAAMCQDETLKSNLLAILRLADLGVVGLVVREEKLFGDTPEGVDSQPETVDTEIREALQHLFAVVKKRGGTILDKRPMVDLIHVGTSQEGVTLKIRDESEGTLAFFALLGKVLGALNSGGTIFVDELDASLHPLLALEVVHLFNDPKVNPRGAQIVFSTHDTNILDKGSLRRDQIWFTEKDSEGGTHLYPLTDFKPRKNENLERGYLQGRYGAVPFIGSSDFLADPHESEAER